MEDLELKFQSAAFELTRTKEAFDALTPEEQEKERANNGSTFACLVAAEQTFLDVVSERRGREQA